MSLGLPAYNGALFLRETLDSILRQTYSDFELIISDDGSTDETVSICEEFAGVDDRVRLTTNSQNRGPARNFNHVFAQSNGELFKWCPQDDVLKPTFLEECVRELDRHPGSVLAYPRAVTRSVRGMISLPWGGVGALNSESLSARWNASMADPRNPMPIELFGVIRSGALRRTRLLEGFPDCDRFLVSQLSLLGPFVIIDRALLVHGEHPSRVGLRLTADSFAAPRLWLGPEGEAVRFPHWWLARAYLSAALASAPSWRERAACAFGVVRWVVRNRRRLGYDLVINAERQPGIGPTLKRVNRQLSMAQWNRRTRRSARRLSAVVPEGARILLVDDDSLDRSFFAAFPLAPFLDGHAELSEAPVDGTAAVHALEQCRSEGVEFLVFCWPAFWWLDYYQELRLHLEGNAKLITADSEVRVYDLRGGAQELQ